MPARLLHDEYCHGRIGTLLSGRVQGQELTMLYTLDGNLDGRIKQAARSRGWTVGAYLSALVQLHEEVRTRADFGDDGTPAAAGFGGVASHRGRRRLAV